MIRRIATAPPPALAGLTLVADLCRATAAQVETGHGRGGAAQALAAARFERNVAKLDKGLICNAMQIAACTGCLFAFGFGAVHA